MLLFTTVLSALRSPPRCLRGLRSVAGTSVCCRRPMASRRCLRPPLATTTAQDLVFSSSSSSSSSAAAAEGGEVSPDGRLQRLVDGAVFKALESERRKAASLEKEAKRAAEAEDLANWAQLVVANLWRCDARTKSLEVDDWATGERRVLTFTKDPRTQADEAFRRCRRLRRSSAVVATLLEATNNRTALLEDAATTDDLDAKLRLARRLGVALPPNLGGDADDDDSDYSDDDDLPEPTTTTTTTKKKQHPKRRRQKQKWSGRTFRSPVSGAAVLVGRNRRENDYLSCVLQSDGDYWLHARGHAGAHVVLQLSKLQRQHQILHDDDLQFAADAAAFYSDVKSESKVDVSVALPRHVLKPPRAPPGTVTLREEYATLVAVPDRHRPYHDDSLKTPT